MVSKINEFFLSTTKYIGKYNLICLWPFSVLVTWMKTFFVLLDTFPKIFNCIDLNVWELKCMCATGVTWLAVWQAYLLIPILFLYIQYTGNLLVWKLRHIDSGSSEFSFAFCVVYLLWQISIDKFIRTGPHNQGDEISFVLIKITCKLFKAQRAQLCSLLPQRWEWGTV